MSIITSINEVITSISNFANDVIARFDVGILGFLTYILTNIVKFLVLAKLSIMILTLNIAWGIASTLLNDIGLFPMINQALQSLSPEVAGFLDLVGINQALNIICTALIARFVMRFIPFA